MDGWRLSLWAEFIERRGGAREESGRGLDSGCVRGSARTLSASVRTARSECTHTFLVLPQTPPPTTTTSLPRASAVPVAVSKTHS